MALQIIYDRILEFPVFQGLGKIDLEDVVGNTKFDFHKFPPKRTIVTADTPCEKLYFLLSGKVVCTRESDDHTYSISEEFEAPMLQQTEAIFGHRQRFTHTVTSITEVGIMTVDRNEMIKFLERYPVVRMNMVNRYATHIQQLTHQVWRHQSSDLTQRLIDFVAAHCLKPTGRKVVRIKMRQMAHELNDNRLNVSLSLNELSDAGLIELRRGHFIIPSMERLINRHSII